MTPYIDSTIALAAASDAPASDPVAQACRLLVTAIGDGRVDGCMSSEGVMEVLQACAWQPCRPEGLTLGEHLLHLFPHPVAVTPESLRLAITLMRSNGRIGPRIALHAGIMQQAGLTTVISTDDEFGLVSGLRRLAPEDAVREFRC